MIENKVDGMKVIVTKETVVFKMEDRKAIKKYLVFIGILTLHF